MIRVESPRVIISRLITEWFYPELGVGRNMQKAVEGALAADQPFVTVVTVERWGKRIVREGRFVDLNKRRVQVSEALTRLRVANEQGDPNAVMRAANDLILGSPTIVLRQGKEV